MLIFDAALAGGLIEGAGKLEYGRTMAFTTSMLFQRFNAFNARLEVHSAFRGLFCNRWLWELCRYRSLCRCWSFTFRPCRTRLGP